MSQMPWVRHFPARFLAETRDMTAAERGVYVTLVNLILEAGGPIPREDARLARVCGVTAPTFKKLLANLRNSARITLLGDGRLSNDGAMDALAERESFSQTQRSKAATRWGKNASQINGRRMPVHMPDASHKQKQKEKEKEKPPALPLGDPAAATLQTIRAIAATADTTAEAHRAPVEISDALARSLGRRA